MKIFVWSRLEELTRSEHDGGGLMIVAEDLNAAISAWYDRCATEGLTAHNRLTDPPDYQCNCDGDPVVIVFPDAGCC